MYFQEISRNLWTPPDLCVLAMWVLGYCPGITQLFPTWHNDPRHINILSCITKVLAIIIIWNRPHLQFPFSLEPISAYKAPSPIFCEFIFIFPGLSTLNWTEMPPKKCWTFLVICLYPDLFWKKSWRRFAFENAYFCDFCFYQILSRTSF